MKTISNLAELEQARLPRLVIALGNFDGVHLGHQQLIKSAVTKAKELNSGSAVVTFNPHPLKILAPHRFPKLLTSLGQRVEHFAALGADYCVLLPFCQDMSKMSPREFVENILLEKLRAVHLCVGFNYSFGFGGKGSPADLIELGQDLGFGVSVVEPQRVDGVIVSSTEIRNALERGNIELATRFLGYFPAITGLVVSGDRRGRTIGYPTANVDTMDDLLIPANGVYAAWVEVNGERLPGMVNIGKKPTFKSEDEITIEAHIFDFNADIYGEKIIVHFYHRLRDERKFNNVDDLLVQLKKDQMQARKLLKNNRILEFGHSKLKFSI